MYLDDKMAIATALFDAYCRTGDSKLIAMAVEFYYEVHGGFPLAWMDEITQRPAAINTYEIKDLFGVNTAHTSKIQAIKHIRQVHGWGLKVAKVYCDKYGNDHREADKNELFYSPIPEDDEQPF
jgi:hypothetical protein